MKITYNNEEFELHYSMRIYIIYENMMDKTVQPEDFYSYTSIVSLFYAAVVATLQYNKKNIQIEYNEFIDWIDENGGVAFVNKFGEWFAKQVNVQMNLVPTQPETKGASKKK